MDWVPEKPFFGVHVLIQRYRGINDRVQQDKMIHILKDTEIYDKDVRIIGYLYWQYKAIIRVEDQISENIEIRISSV